MATNSSFWVADKIESFSFRSLETMSRLKRWAAASILQGADVFGVPTDFFTKSVIKAFHFEMREISRYIQLSRIAAYKPTHSTGGVVFPSERGTEFCLLFIVQIMIGLKITDSQKYMNFITGKDGSPLIEVASCCGLYTRFYDQLLSSKESFDDVDGKTTVTIEQKLKELYDVLFGMTNADNDLNLYETVVGQYSFNQGTRNTLIRTVSLLSKYTSTEFV